VWARVEIIEEDPTDPATFGTVGDIEIFVAPLLECWEEDSPMCIASCFKHGVEVYRVLLEEVGGS
jgi:hypothetical protein